jgi:replicative DNA helicase
MDENKKRGLGKTGMFKLITSKELINDSFKDIERVYEHKAHLNSIASYSVGLDSLLNGLHRSNLIVIASRPGEGKSAFVHNLINCMAMQEVPTLLCSPEMCKETVALRLLSINSSVSCKVMESGTLGEHDWPRLTTAAGNLSQTVLNIDDTLPLPVQNIFKIANELRNNGKLELLIVDSLPFITAENNESKDDAISIMMALKQLARHLKIPVLLTLPLKTESANSQQTLPCLNDIGCDSIVDITDVIILLHKVLTPNKKKCRVEALVVKNRNGALGDVSFNFIYESMRFKDCSNKQTREMH